MTEETQIEVQPKRRGRAPGPIKHGTITGHAQHYSRKELPVCEPCKQARSDYEKARREQKKSYIKVDKDEYQRLVLASENLRSIKAGIEVVTTPTGYHQFLGSLPVDSGQMMFIDPCYVADRLNYDELIAGWSAAGAAKNHIQVVDKLGIVTSTGWGDGNYPVYATMQNDRVASVTVVFISNDDNA